MCCGLIGIPIKGKVAIGIFLYLGCSMQKAAQQGNFFLFAIINRQEIGLIRFISEPS